MRVRSIRIERGAVDFERVVTIPTSSGTEEDVIVHSSLVEDDTLPVGEIRLKDDAVLVELPQESTRGNWRVWVPRSAVTA